MKRHLAVEHELTPNQYRETFGLKSDYPMAAPNLRPAAARVRRQDRPGTTEQGGAPPTGLDRTAKSPMQRPKLIREVPRPGSRPSRGSASFVGRIEVREDQREGLASLVAELRWRKDQTAKRHDAGRSRPRLLSAYPCGSSAGVVPSDRRSALHRTHPANRSRPDNARVKAIARACRRPLGPAPPAREVRATIVTECG